MKDQGLYHKVLKDIWIKLAYDNVKDVRISLGKMCCFVFKKKSNINSLINSC